MSGPKTGKSKFHRLARGSFHEFHWVGNRGILLAQSKIFHDRFGTGGFTATIDSGHWGFNWFKTNGWNISVFFALGHSIHRHEDGKEGNCHRMDYWDNSDGPILAGCGSRALS